MDLMTLAAAKSAAVSEIEAHITYGTEDLVDGTSELATGSLYCVYE